MSTNKAEQVARRFFVADLFSPSPDGTIHFKNPYVNDNRESSDDAAVVIMDYFKGQVTPAVTKLLEDNNIHVCLLPPPNTTDKLQPMDLAINKYLVIANQIKIQLSQYLQEQ